MNVWLKKYDNFSQSAEVVFTTPDLLQVHSAATKHPETGTRLNGVFLCHSLGRNQLRSFANRRKPNPKNRVEEATEMAVAAFAIEQPAFGQVRVSNELRKRGIFISPSGIRSVWLRRDLESFKKRLSALQRHVAETGGALTEAQVSALEKKQEDDVCPWRD